MNARQLARQRASLPNRLPQRDSHDRLLAQVTAELAGLLDTPLEAGLYLVATPIGHMGDITLRALAVLAKADRVYCEDTRQSRKLFARFAITRQLAAYHEHNAARERPQILRELAAGQTVALLCDAGTPLICDPGYKLVTEAAAAGHDVYGVPGASAALAALVCAGLPTDGFYFGGFLPAKAGARKRRIAELAGIDATLILYEAPSRLATAMADLAQLLGPRQAVIGRELTKVHEEMHRGTLQQLAELTGQRALKGEMVVVIAPPPATPVADADIIAGLTTALEHASVRDAAAAVALRLGVTRSRVYDLAIALRGQAADER